MKKIITALMVIIIMITNTCIASTFIDVTSKYEIPVNNLVKLNIMEGIESDYFGILEKVSADDMTEIMINCGFSKDEVKKYKDIRSTCNIVKEEAISKTGNVTFAEVVTYLVRLLGYGPEIDSEGAWPTNYLIKARDLNISNGIDLNSADEIKRGELSILLWNTLNTKVLEENALGETLLDKKFSNVELNVGEKMIFSEDIINLEPTHAKALKLLNVKNEEIITYSSSNPDIVTVNDIGIIKAQTGDGGMVTISAKKSNGKSAKCTVIVPRVAGIKIAVGKNIQLKSLNEDDEWVISDKTIVSFSKGVLTAKKAGDCTVTAYLKGENDILTARYKINVEKELGSVRIKIDGDNIYNIKVGDTINLNAEVVSTIEDDDVSRYEIGWSSDNSSVATVKGNDDNAKVTAKGVGSCNIIVSSNGMKSTIKVNVTSDTDKIEFKDVKSDEWYYESVKYAITKGLFKGVSDNEFAPNVTMNRAMLVTVLHRLEGEKKTSYKNKFIDLADNAYYENAVNWATKNNIVSGVSEKEFAPSNQVTREQLVVMLYRYAKLKGVNTSKKADLTSFEDYNEISDYAKDATAWAVKSGYINGRSGNFLAPKQTATRAEVATILMRFSET